MYKKNFLIIKKNRNINVPCKLTLQFQPSAPAFYWAGCRLEMGKVQGQNSPLHTQTCILPTLHPAPCTCIIHPPYLFYLIWHRRKKVNRADDDSIFPLVKICENWKAFCFFFPDLPLKIVRNSVSISSYFQHFQRSGTLLETFVMLLVSWIRIFVRWNFNWLV